MENANPSSSFQNPVEEFVFRLCRRSFLSLWSYANPRRHGDTKELCDILVLCEPHVIVISVKEAELADNQMAEVSIRRWWKKAVEGSVKQLYGAVRNLAQAEHVTRADGTRGLPLPVADSRAVHRVSVSLGAERKLLVPSSDFGKGFVHVLDQESLRVVMGALDTVTDFVNYLEAKENLCQQHPGLVVEGGEKNLLATYLMNDKAFPPQPPSPDVMRHLWDDFVSSDAFRRKQRGDQPSYAWDEIVDWLSREALAGRMGFAESLTDSERALRYMAREPRLERRVLASAFYEFRRLASEGKVRARFVPSTSGVAYVFHDPPPDYSRDLRIKDLRLRCTVARDALEESDKYPRCQTVVGIGANVAAAPQGFATDIYVLDAPAWTEEDREAAATIRRNLGYFGEPDHKSVAVDEYPRS